MFSSLTRAWQRRREKYGCSERIGVAGDYRCGQTAHRGTLFMQTRRSFLKAAAAVPLAGAGLDMVDSFEAGHLRNASGSLLASGVPPAGGTRSDMYHGRPAEYWLGQFVHEGDAILVSLALPEFVVPVPGGGGNIFEHWRDRGSRNRVQGLEELFWIGPPADIAIEKLLFPESGLFGRRAVRQIVFERMQFLEIPPREAASRNPGGRAVELTIIPVTRERHYAEDVQMVQATALSCLAIHPPTASLRQLHGCCDACLELVIAGKCLRLLVQQEDPTAEQRNVPDIIDADLPIRERTRLMREHTSWLAYFGLRALGGAEADVRSMGLLRFRVRQVL
jgi:hypothetical protein